MGNGFAMSIIGEPVRTGGSGTTLAGSASLCTSVPSAIAIAALMFIPLYGAALAIGGAPWARAYLDLRQMPDTDVAQVFG